MPLSDQCRGCAHTGGLEPFCDLGSSPLANAYLTADQLQEPEQHYPLAPRLCPDCLLVQLPELVAPERIFSDYAYFSSQSAAFVAHAGRFATEAVERFRLTPQSLVVEIASNDGYLLQHFQAAGVRCYGVEPAQNVALAALKAGVPTIAEFFDATLVCDRLLDTAPSGVTSGGRADLIVANNVLAHVPNLGSFLHGVRLLLAPDGVFSFEVPWLRRLVEQGQFDTIYHEHFSYFLLRSLERALGLAGLRIFDAEQLEVHGGSLRVYACHRDRSWLQPTPRLVQLFAAEDRWLATDPLRSFADRPARAKRELLAFLLDQHAQGRTVAGYGAAAKGNTLLNYCGIGPELIECVADSTPAKQGCHLPGSRIPIISPDQLAERRSDTVLILPWNHAPEIAAKLGGDGWHPLITWQTPDGIHAEIRNDSTEWAEVA